MVLLRSRRTRETSTALVLACTAAAYASRPLNAIGREGLGGIYIEGFAALGLWSMLLDLPRPLLDSRWRRVIVAIAGGTAACALFGLVDMRFLPLEKIWRSDGLQIWELTIPTALAALLFLTARSIWLGSDLGPVVLFSLGPLVVQLSLEATFPEYEAWWSQPAHRALILGFILAALLTLPLWLLLSPPERNPSYSGNRIGLDGSPR